jgi:hypothetical protein
MAAMLMPSAAGAFSPSCDSSGTDRAFIYNCHTCGFGHNLQKLCQRPISC